MKIARYTAVASALLHCVAFATEQPKPQLGDLFAHRPVAFTPEPNGKSYLNWSPGRALRVEAGGWQVIIDSADQAPARISMQIAGAGSATAVSLEGASPARTAWFRGSRGQWHAEETEYRRVTFRNLLKGVDVVCHGDGSNQLEYDLLLAPGADPSAIRLRFTGQDTLQLDENGDLAIQAGGTRILQRMPAIYQQAGNSLTLVEGSYVLRDDGEVELRIGAYDHNRPLVVDPVVEYAAFPGGGGDDKVVAVARDSKGFLYIAGTTRSSDLATTGSAYQTAISGDEDIFVMKIDPAADAGDSVLYSTFIGGTGTDEVNAMVLGADDVLYLTGGTGSTNFPVSSGAYSSTSKGATDIFALKLDLTQDGTGALVYSTYVGGTGIDVALGAALAKDGTLTVVGYTSSTDFPMAGAQAQSTNAGGWDAVIAQISPTGGLGWSTYLGSNSTDVAQAITLPDDGSIVVAGWTASGGFPMAGAPLQRYYGGHGDGFLARVVASKGTSGLVYSTFLGGSDLEVITAITSWTGKFVVTGYTFSDDFPIAAGAFQKQNGGDADTFLSVIDLNAPAGQQLVQSTYLGGSSADIAHDVKVDSSGNAFLTGYTFSSDFPLTPGALQSALPAYRYGGFLAKLSLAQGAPESLLYSTFLSAAGLDVPNALLLDATGRVYLAGSERVPGSWSGAVLAIRTCIVTIPVTQGSVPAAGGAGSFQVQADTADCGWSATSTADWIAITSGQTGQGNGSVGYTTAPNPGTNPRNGVIQVGPGTFTVQQAGRT